MKNIKLLNKIAKCGTDIFDESYTVSDVCEKPDAIMVRSAVMHDMEFGPELKAIARAGAGVNNIPLDRCAEQGIVVFNTPGSERRTASRSSPYAECSSPAVTLSAA